MKVMIRSDNSDNWIGFRSNLFYIGLLLDYHIFEYELDRIKFDST